MQVQPFIHDRIQGCIGFYHATLLGRIPVYIAYMLQTADIHHCMALHYTLCRWPEYIQCGKAFFTYHLEVGHREK